MRFFGDENLDGPDSDDPHESKPGRISVPSAFARRASVAKRRNRP